MASVMPAGSLLNLTDMAFTTLPVLSSISTAMALQEASE